MALNYNDVQQYYNSKIAVFGMLEEAILKDIDRLRQPLRVAGHEDPVYTVTSRVKKLGSLYLKSKRKQLDDVKELSTLEDYVGVRMLCLFEQNLRKVNEMLLKEFSGKSEVMLLSEFTAYNWKDGSANSMQKAADDYFMIHEDRITDTLKKKFISRNESKGSGYKSIHYILYYWIGDSWLPIEIQLRTIVQEVWGQIEHALSYKKSDVDPHVQESFRFLSRHLENADDLIRYLREITDKGSLTSQYFQERYRPRGWMVYERDIIPVLFAKTQSVKKAINNYHRQAKGYSRTFTSEQMKSWLRETWDELILLDTVVSQLRNETFPNSQSQDEVKLSYWFSMEIAFLLFCGPLPEFENDSVARSYIGAVLSRVRLDDRKKKYYDFAFDIYHRLHTDTARETREFIDERYVLYFRLGEICHMKGKVEEALKKFEICEKILASCRKRADCDSQISSDQYNEFSIHIKLAHIYWTLGPEYYQLAVRRIDKAWDVYATNQELINATEDHEHMMWNNLVWYHSELFSSLKNEIQPTSKPEKQKTRQLCHEIAQKYMRALEKLPVEHRPKDFNDTAAWYYYNLFRAGPPFGELAHLDKAKDYARKMWEDDGNDAEGPVVYFANAIEMKKIHLREILYAQKVDFVNMQGE
ncbi:MAG: RelA/SpoT domain-containing protein [Magnetococcales bacterium]|nr:RelA/SpoT domain-containing protein [Magnetococcales bacterium]